MKTILPILFVAATPLMAELAKDDGDAKNPLTGRWRIDSGPQSEHVKLPDVIYWEFSDDKFSVIDGETGKKLSNSSYKIFTDRDPMWITSVSHTKWGNSPEVLGIFRVEGKKLILSQGQPGAPRPKDFLPRPTLTFMKEEAEQAAASNP